MAKRRQAVATKVERRDAPSDIAKRLTLEPTRKAIRDEYVEAKVDEVRPYVVKASELAAKYGAIELEYRELIDAACNVEGGVQIAQPETSGRVLRRGEALKAQIPAAIRSLQRIPERFEELRDIGTGVDNHEAQAADLVARDIIHDVKNFEIALANVELEIPALAEDAAKLASWLDKHGRDLVYAPTLPEPTASRVVRV